MKGSFLKAAVAVKNRLPSFRFAMLKPSLVTKIGHLIEQAHHHDVAGPAGAVIVGLDEILPAAIGSVTVTGGELRVALHVDRDAVRRSRTSR